VSVMEIMALGLPIVSTNVGGLPYLLDDEINAILVDKNDSIAMTEAIVRLLKSNAFVEEITKNAREKVEKFDWAHLKEAWNNIFKNADL